MTVWSWESNYATRQEPIAPAAVIAAVPLLRAAIEAGEEAGACHVVLADVNLDQHFVRYCRDQENISPEGAAAMDALLAMPMRERAIALCLANGEAFHACSEEEWAVFDFDPENDDPVDHTDD